MSMNARTWVRESVFLPLRRWASRTRPQAAPSADTSRAVTLPLWGPSSGPVPGNPPGTVREEDGSVTQL